MKRANKDCRDDLITALVQGSLEETQEVQVAEHLNQCNRCRQRLEAKTASSDLWQDIQQTLSEQPYDAASGLLSTNQLMQTGVGQRLEESGDDVGDRVVGDGVPVLAPSVQHVLNSLAPTDDPEKLGRIGHHEVQGVVGAGGMGVVLKAFDPALDRMVAIKILAPHLATSGAARQRFAREAKAAAAVLHPNVVAIHGVSDGGSTGLPYLVMPYVRGATLQARIDLEGGLPLIEILQVAAQVADGLGAAHQQGLVHRDIKPANIMLEDGVERVSIMDFGLARTVDDATLTQSGVIAGTPQYMSPEQARGDSVDTRSDLFSLGSLLYVMSTGRPPFRAETAYGILRRITDETARPVREVRPDLPLWLGTLIGRLHAKSVDDRFQSASEVADVLRGCLAHVQSASSELPEVLRQKPNYGSWGRITALLFMVIAVAASALFWFPLQNDKQQPTVSSSPSDQANAQMFDESQHRKKGLNQAEMNKNSASNSSSIGESLAKDTVMDAGQEQLLRGFQWQSNAELDALQSQMDVLDESSKAFFISSHEE